MKHDYISLKRRYAGSSNKVVGERKARAGIRCLAIRFLMVFLLFGAFGSMAQSTISGTVIDEETGEGLPGATVFLKGSTSTGTVTDLDGKFTINARPFDVLVFSSIGFIPQEVSIDGQKNLEITMLVDVQSLEEVVVTAFGLKREKKALTYSAQSVGIEELAEARSLNVANSLSGKVAGLNFSTTGGGVGSASRVTLRGTRSIQGNNQPLYVVDGVPIDNSVRTTENEEGGDTSSDGISNLNPEDIESVSVLKGPSAAALYGTRASNGVIIITTKKGVEGRTKVTVSSNFMLSKAYNLMNLQNTYGQGFDGAYDPRSGNSWGPQMAGQTVSAYQLEYNPSFSGPSEYALTPQPDNAIDFFQTGYNWSKTISATMGNQKAQGYFSYTHTEAEGIVPGNELGRHNFNLRLTSQLSEKLSFDSKLNFISQEVDNSMNTGTNSIGSSVYLLPRNLPHSMYEDFEYIDELGAPQYNFINGDEGAAGGNPYWRAYRELRNEKRNRVIGFASLKYNILDELSLQVRTGIDHISDKTTASDYAALAINQTETGRYSERFGQIQELNADFLLAYQKQLGEFSLGLNFGGNTLSQRQSSASIGGILSKRDFFSVNNINSLSVSPGVRDKTINSLYAFSQLGYKDYLYLDLTFRNDWSSALPADNWSFPYASAGLSAIVTDIFEIDSDVLSLLKLRTSFAEVGNDTDPYRLADQLVFSGQGVGFLTTQTNKGNPNLLPEISSSFEWGASAHFFEGKISIDFTMFQTNTKNQIFLVNTPQSSGFATAVANGGEIENTGVELVVSANVVDRGDFSWDVTANYASYDSKVLSLNEGREELPLSGERIVRTKAVVGGTLGDLFIRGFERTDDGQVIVGDNGLPEVTSGLDVKAGNFNPDWTGGIQNRLQYKNISMSFLLDFRIGGEVVSYTQAIQSGLGVTTNTLEGREDDILVDGVVVNDDGSTTPNTTPVSAQDYWIHVGSQNAVGEDFIYDATNIRLREAVIGYSFPEKILANTPFSSATFSLVGRNLFFLLNKAEYFDPEVGVGVGNLQGVESFTIPSTRNFGCNIRLTF